MKRDENGRGIFPEEVTKMQNRWKRIGLGLVSLGLVLGLILTAALPTCEAVPAEEVKVGMHAAWTGPLASAGVRVCPATIDCGRLLNEQGGINGVQVKVIWEDTRMEPARDISAHKRFQRAGVVLEVVYASTSGDAIASLSQRDAIPVIFQGDVTLPMITQPLKWQFSGGPGYPAYITSFVKWMTTTWTEPRPLRVGLMLADYPGSYDIIEGLRQHASEVGVEFIGYELIPFFGTLDTSTEWLRLVEKKPDWLVDGVPGGVSLTVSIKDAQRLEISRKGIRMAGGYPIDEAVVPTVGKDALEGWYILRRSPTNFDTELRGMKAVFEAAKKYRGRGPGEVSGIYIDGWIAALVGFEGIRLAIEKVGFENLSGHAVRDALASLSDFETGLIPPITMSNEQPYYGRFYRVYQFEQAMLVPVTDWFEAAFLPEY